MLGIWIQGGLLSKTSGRAIQEAPSQRRWKRLRKLGGYRLCMGAVWCGNRQRSENSSLPRMDVTGCQDHEYAGDSECRGCSLEGWAIEFCLDDTWTTSTAAVESRTSVLQFMHYPYVEYTLMLEAKQMVRRNETIKASYYHNLWKLLYFIT